MYENIRVPPPPPPHRVVGGVGRSGAGESDEDPGWNLSYNTRCCPVLLHRFLIRIISLFQCGLPKETPILKNVLFCVVLVPETRDTPFSPPPIPAPKHSLVYSYTYTFEYHGTYPVHSSRGTKVEKMLTLAPERYTAGFCMVAKVILWCI